MPRRRKRRRLARQTTTTKSQSAEEGEWSLSWEGQGITGMGRAPRLHTVLWSQHWDKGLSAKLLREPATTAWFSVPKTGAQQQRDTNPRTACFSAHVRDLILSSHRQSREQERAWPEQHTVAFRKGRATAHTEPHKNTAGTSHSSPLPMPQNLFNQPRPPHAHTQATDVTEWGRFSGGLQREVVRG